MAYQKWHQKNLESGLCKDCGKQKKHATSILCPSCAKKHSNRSSLYKKRKRKEWRAAGLCYECGKSKETNKLRCNKCHKKLMAYNIKTRKLRELRRKKDGVCYKCGAPVSYKSHNLCTVCLFKKYSDHATGVTKHWKFLQDLLSVQDYKCPYTGETIVFGLNASIDHIIPRTHKNYPGDNDLNNLCWTTQKTNLIKNNMDKSELILFCEAVIKHINGSITKQNVNIKI